MNQILKDKVDIFNEFVINIGLKEHNYIIINENIFKRALYNNLITPFYNDIEKYYYESKKYYLKRNITYNGFITILRQISKKNGIEFKSQIKYANSKHSIEYYFYVLETI